MEFKDSNLINPKEPKLVENKFPNVVFQKIISTPIDIPVIHPFQTFGDLGSDAVIPTENEIRDFAKGSTQSLVQMKNVFVTNEGIMYSNNVFYPDQCDCHWRVCKDFKENIYPNLKVSERIPKAVVIMHEYGWFYAHWLCDFLPRLLLLPSDVLKDAKLIVTNYASFGYECVKIAGIPKKNLLAPPADTAVFVENLYTITPLYCSHFVPFLFINMRKIIAQKAELDQTPPTKYIFYNREGSEFRKIDNYNDVLNYIKSVVPEVMWENCHIPNSIIDQAKLFNSFKVFFAMHGAAFANTLFMQPDTCVVEIQVDRWVDNYLWVTAFAQVHHFITRNSKIQWRDFGSKNYLEANDMAIIAQKAVDTVKKGKWK
ncbi:hypothetical protein TVAG_051060 [Trichomonas vaginalis G3]|uniref:Glycosyltransferase 61 catalytic domain-containing protein n=1 Tax=Trichomonas vaginalis (strain ATCC PRA-98 / G3) TaxID=412133 RepID=A2EER5_TRIV3|nr:protein of unknown function, DUF563 family [Trichomonas vaginalis G3]EAY08871.1 hypothetical protein TVAG_051060 [Trichomonas vaginalis G3]KAI5489366.1 protein of unknown function, DUF563 family [Trichomonas vaginalis G3]|eukprot:XP_001321094.1 hypothetical protein [Trichomonas vaginalis G3]